MVMPSIIDQSQSAFVKGRKISDNILLAQELFRNYHRSSGSSRCAIKIDLRKAFDTVRWDFLFDTMSAFKFPHVYTNWIKTCVSTAMFSIKINGSLAGFFSSTRGLRQGDPLSPYLFVLVMEMLSIKLNSGSREPSFKFHWRAKECHLTHLFFADDILLFSHADSQSITIIHSCIQSFSLFFGLIPNANKSFCFFANTDSVTIQGILSIMGYQLGTLPTKFLGVPLISSKLSFNDCIPLIHRITQRASSWTSTFLAYSGRLQLIKSILFSIQAFWCNHFLLPKAAIRAIQSVLCRFLWKGSSLAQHGAKVSWSAISMPTSEGGLGLKSLLDWNRALIISHLLQIIQFQSSSLWAMWIKVTILKNRSLWQIPTPTDCSWIWKQVLKLRPLALLHLHYKIGRGDRFSLWYDPWINGTAINPSPRLVLNSGIPASATVNSILLDSSWNLPTSNYHDVILLRRRLESLPPPPPQEDCILWDSLDIITVKAKHVWESIRSRQQPVSWSFIPWNKLHVPRYSFMLWLGILKRIPTNDRFAQFTGRSMTCQLCQLHYETFDHLFFLCDYSQIIFKAVMDLGQWHSIPHSWDDTLAFLTTFQGTKLTRNILCLSLAVTVYKIWEARNNKLHNNIVIPPLALAKDITYIIKSRLSTCKSFLKAAAFCQYYCTWLL